MNVGIGRGRLLAESAVEVVVTVSGADEVVAVAGGGMISVEPFPALVTAAADILTESGEMSVAFTVVEVAPDTAAIAESTNDGISVPGVAAAGAADEFPRCSFN